MKKPKRRKRRGAPCAQKANAAQRGINLSGALYIQDKVPLFTRLPLFSPAPPASLTNDVMAQASTVQLTP